MANPVIELPLPYYKLVAWGPNENGYEIHIHVQTNNGGITGTTDDGLADYLRDYLEGLTDVSTTLTKYTENSVTL
jgi:glutamine synthetase